MYPVWLLTQSKETERNGAPPLPKDVKPLDFMGVFDSVEQVKKADFLYVGQLVTVLNKKRGPICYVVESVDPVELVEVEGEMTDCPSKVCYNTADDEDPDCAMCDYQCGSFFCNICGPEYGWAWYRRTLIPEEENDEYN